MLKRLERQGCHSTGGSVLRASALLHQGARFACPHEFDLGEVEIDFILFVPHGASQKKYFIVKEDRELKEDILKAILETDEGEAAEVLGSAAKLLKAYKDELPEGALQILAKACGLPGPETKEKIDAAAWQCPAGRGRSRW